MKARIRYVERTTPNHDGPAWIGRVTLSKTGRTVYYRGMTLRRIQGGAVNGNHVDIATGDEYWVFGVKRGRQDRQGAGSGSVEIDEDVRDEYLRGRKAE